MKQLFLILFIFGASKFGTAQPPIPDGNFEESYYIISGGIGTVGNPNWRMSDSEAVPVVKEWVGVLKPFEGKYMVKVTNKYHIPTNTDTISRFMYQKFTYNDRPVCLTMLADFSCVTKNEFFCVEIVFSHKSKIVGYTLYKTDTNLIEANKLRWSPSLYSIPLTYQSAETPDSCLIKIWSSNCDGTQPRVYPKNAPMVDDLRFHDTMVQSQLHLSAEQVVAYKRAPAPLTLHPNPAGSSLTLGYSLPQGGQVVATLIDVQGRQVKTLLSGLQQAGPQSHTLSLSGVAPGLYLVRLQTPGQEMIKKLVVE